MADLAGKIALVTGASRGIGVAIAQALAGAGASVGLAARSLEPCEALAGMIEGAGGNALVMACDVSKNDDVESAVEEVIQHWGGLDILINNAGVIDPIGPFADSDPADWARSLEINLIGAAQVARAAIPHLRKGGGVIVNISSGAAETALEGWSAYCAGKAGLAMLTQALHLEEAPHGLRVYGFKPGTVDTQMQAKVRASGLNPVSQMRPRDHLPAEVPARVIAWLCSEAAADLAGRELSIRDAELCRRAGVTP